MRAAVVRRAARFAWTAATLCMAAFPARCGGDGRSDGHAAAGVGDAALPKAQAVRGAVLYSGDTLGRPQTIGVVGEWVLVGDVPRPHALHVISRRDGRPLASWGREGKGPGEFEDLWGIQDAGGREAWLFDSGQGRLTRVDVAALVAGATDPVRRMLALRSELAPLSALWVADTLLVSAGMFTRGRLAHFDSGGALRRVVGALPNAGQGVPPEVAQHAYSGTLARHPTRPLVAIGTRHADRVEIYDAAGRVVTVGRGPARFEPAFRVQVRGNDPLMASGGDLRFGYVDLTAAGDRLYGLYSGRTRGELPGRANFGDQVHVFDWSGRLVQVLTLDARVLGIAVAAGPGGRTLYATRYDPEPAVLRYDIPPE